MNLLDLFFPARCVGCGKIGSYICQKCQKTIEFIPQRCPECDRQAIGGMTHPRCLKTYGLNGVISVFRYDGVVKKTIKALKYRLISDVAKTLITLIPHEPVSWLPQGLVLYPMPLHKDRLRWRGFNQAEILGTYLNKKLNILTVSDLLDRRPQQTAQADIHDRAARIKNAQGLFTLKTKKLPENILLFDDVYTTGATMKAAAQVLKRGRVKIVWGLSVAR